MQLTSAYLSNRFLLFNLAEVPALISMHVAVKALSSEDSSFGIDPSLKRHRLVHNGRFPNLEALYYSLNVVSSTEIS